MQAFVSLVSSGSVPVTQLASTKPCAWLTKHMPCHKARRVHCVREELASDGVLPQVVPHNEDVQLGRISGVDGNAEDSLCGKTTGRRSGWRWTKKNPATRNATEPDDADVVTASNLDDHPEPFLGNS